MFAFLFNPVNEETVPTHIGAAHVAYFGRLTKFESEIALNYNQSLHFLNWIPLK